MKFNKTITLIVITLSNASGFAPINPTTTTTRYQHNHAIETGTQYTKDSALNMAQGAKKKRRRRKEAPTSGAPKTSSPEGSQAASGEDLPSIDELKSLAKFSASGNRSPLNDSVPSNNLSPLGDGAAESKDSLQVELPDIRDALKMKEMKKVDEEELQLKARPRISRNDRKAMLELLEAEPFADADPDYFEIEKYGTISALLGEGAKDFLGIPPGPLQVGHFIGALGIVLCAFVEYPGFPLTNLPTPLRGALQGGLLTIYIVNAVFAVLAAFKAAERGQSSLLWAVKTFSVGGLAFDQLTQLPTLKEVAELESRKGARALKKNKK